MKSVRLFTIMLFCISSQFTFAQTSDKIAVDLSGLFDKLENFGLYNKNDSLIQNIDSLIEDKISTYIKTAPAALVAAFPKLGVVSSPDSVLSILSWDNQTGGTQHSYTNLFFFKTNGYLNYINYDTVSDDGEFGHYYSYISMVKVGNKTYYLIIYKGLVGLFEQMEGIQVFSIDDNKLNNKAKLIKTRKGFTYKLRFQYVHNLQTEGITYDAKSKEIIFPLVDEKGHETDNSIIYKFNGKYFERLKK